MQTKLLKGIEPLSIDKEILAVTKKNASPWDAGDSYRLAIRNASGVIYRVIECDSLGIYMGLEQCIEALGLLNEVPKPGTVSGFDAIFRQPEVAACGGD